MSTSSRPPELGLVPASFPYVLDLGAVQRTLQSPALNFSVPARFPCYAHLDLYEAGVTPDPECGLNFANLTWIWKLNWTYTVSLEGLLDKTDHGPCLQDISVVPQSRQLRQHRHVRPAYRINR